MKKLTTIFAASFLAISTVHLGGCAVATAGVKKGDERNMARSINDISAARAIKARMTRVEGFNLKGVDIEVAEGVALLSGHVPTPEDRVEAERIAWSGPQIIQVGNEVRISGKKGLIRGTKDSVLHQTIFTKLTANKNIKARNFNLEVYDGVVYLLGVARTPEELAHAAHIASTTKGTRKVISYARIAGASDSTSAYAAAPAYQNSPSPVQNMPALPNSSPIPYTPNAGSPNAGSVAIPLPAIPQVGDIVDGDAIESGEPYYLDPQTGERIEIPEGVTPIPYTPDNSPGSLGAGGQPLPPGMQPSQILGAVYKPTQ